MNKPNIKPGDLLIGWCVSIRTLGIVTSNVYKCKSLYGHDMEAVNLYSTKNAHTDWKLLCTGSTTKVYRNGKIVYSDNKGKIA